MNHQTSAKDRPLLRLLILALWVPLGGLLASCGASGPVPAPFSVADQSGTPVAGSCGDGYRETDYVPSKSDAIFERDGVRVAIHQLPTKALTIEVSSNDGRFDHTRLDPGQPLYEGLEVTTTVGYGWDFNYDTLDYELEPGQITTTLRVYDCWAYVSGPDIF